MDSDDKKLFLRRYASRINNMYYYWSMDEWYTFYTEKGEDKFLNKLEDEEEYNDFCRKYYDVLREAYNICSAGMYDYYQMYKVKFGSDKEGFEYELKQDKRVAKIMKYYI
jgi:hypothetical protein